MTESILTALLGALAGATIVWLHMRSRQAALAERVRSRDEAIARLAGADSERIELERTLIAERATANEKIAAFNEAREKLAADFKALSSDALKSNSNVFIQFAEQTLRQYQQKAESDLDARKQAIDSLVKPLRESLEKVDDKIAELERKRAGAYGQLGQQLESLNSAQMRLQAEATKLSNAFRSTSYAGSWGELQLRRVVELADMLSYCDFTEQESSTAADGKRLRADLVVRLPGGQKIVVDAKTSMQSYRDAVDAADEETRSRKLAEHARHLRLHIDQLGAKNYWRQFHPAPEFVVLFVPGDHFLTAALQESRDLLDHAIGKKVLLATPTTLIALLKAAAYGWRQEAISKNADEVSKLGRALYDRLVTFAEHMDKVGRSLGSATKSFNAAVGSFEGSLLPGARKFEELGAKGQKQLNDPAQVETAPREISKNG